MNENELTPITSAHALVEASRVVGQVDADENAWLFDLISQRLPDAQDGIILELGSNKGGGSTVLLAAALRRGWTLDCIDFWYSGILMDRMSQAEGAGYKDDYHTLIKHLTQMASLIDAWGQKARNAVRHHIVDTIDFLTRWKPQGPVPFAFLDAGKAGMQQKDEWLTIAPWVPVGGVIAVHDANDCDWINSQASLEAEGKMAPWEELTYPVQPHNFQRPVRPYDVGWRTRAWRRTR